MSWNSKVGIAIMSAVTCMSVVQLTSVTLVQVNLHVITETSPIQEESWYIVLVASTASHHNSAPRLAQSATNDVYTNLLLGLS